LVERDVMFLDTSDSVVSGLRGWSHGVSIISHCTCGD
jgi:hypothetical protein